MPPETLTVVPAVKSRIPSSEVRLKLLSEIPASESMVNELTSVIEPVTEASPIALMTSVSLPVLPVKFPSIATIPAVELNEVLAVNVTLLVSSMSLANWTSPSRLVVSDTIEIVLPVRVLTPDKFTTSSPAASSTTLNVTLFRTSKLIMSSPSPMSKSICDKSESANVSSAVMPIVIGVPGLLLSISRTRSSIPSLKTWTVTSSPAASPTTSKTPPANEAVTLSRRRSSRRMLCKGR